MDSLYSTRLFTPPVATKWSQISVPWTRRLFSASRALPPRHRWLLGMGSAPHHDRLRHVGSGGISRLNAVVLGEALAAEENNLVFPSHDFSRHAHISSPEQYQNMYERSIEDPAGFWSDIASQFCWKKRWNPEVCSENIDVRRGTVKIEWFKGGVTNICYNALDRNIEAGNGDKVALYWEGNEPGQDAQLTYAQMLEKVCQLANYLKNVGVGKGDTVIIYLPMLMELPIAMLACARIGAIHSVVFAGFSADSLSQRIVDCKPKAVISCNAVCRGAKVIHLKEIVDTALVESVNSGVPVDLCLIFENKSAMKRESTKWQIGRDVWWQDVVPQFPTKCLVEWVDAEDPLFLLYTSGSTGKPKGVLHTNGGYMVYTATTFKYAFDYKQSDVYWCTADCGWITGHSYITYGPLLNGATILVFEGYVTRYSRKSLRILGSVGEPINPSAWRWFYNVVGDSRCPISDTWWQTETGGFMITPIPGAWPQKPGSATFPFFGIQPVIVDEKGNEIEGECTGDKDGYHWLTGRVDDVINVSGHRIGTAEVESALVSHPHCAEAAVVGVDHEVKGQGIYAFVTLVDGIPYSEEVRKSLILAVRNQIGAFAAPDKIHWAPAIPKTRSGKIMRRILRKIASRQLDELGDTSTLVDPSVVDQLIALIDH
ncbi:hypothetical protein C4D60_Mb06t12460 [Musa balbisiana]|uniref:Acetate--CoA ligase n=1 Tax=Musa balbisiana TaxID=52838 RepID=A0A4S8INU7_MUSBA|nr:hypothetical protein C4D60_Mb06t12460 [Musa balbisiana]